MWKLKGNCAELALERGYMLRESGHQSGLIGAKALSNALLTMFVNMGKDMCLIGPVETSLRSNEELLTSC